MSDPWKPQPGPAMVMVTYVSKDGTQANIENGERSLFSSALRPLPPALIPEAQAALDAVTAWRAAHPEPPHVWDGYATMQEIVRTIDAYHAAIAPKPVDPLTIAMEALTKLAYLGNGNVPGNSDGNRIAQDALTAIHAARPAP